MCPTSPADSRALFETFQRDDLHRELTRDEDALLRAGARQAGKAVAAGTWRTTSDRAVKRYMRLCTQSAINSAARGRTFAYRELTKAAIVGVLGLAAVGLSLWFAVRGARRISRRLEALRDAADLLTNRQLPQVMERLGAGEEVDAAAEAPPLADVEAVADEIGQVGRSFNTARLAAVEAAVKQATLRRGLFAVLLNIARRNQALVHRQLKLVDTLERRTDDPDVLDDLFRIDHLTTRMRRHAESLIILSGSAPGRRWRRPVPVAEVVSSAVSEIEQYTRVVVPPMPEVGIAADAVADVVHLIAELVENATVFSPPRTQVTLRTGRAGSGFVLEIDDRGLGLEPDQIDEAHRTLTTPEDFDPTRHDRLGLYVVGKLAARHGIKVTLCRSPYGGTTAVVLLPEAVLAPVETTQPHGGHGSGGASHADRHRAPRRRSARRPGNRRPTPCRRRHRNSPCCPPGSVSGPWPRSCAPRHRWPTGRRNVRSRRRRCARSSEPSSVVSTEAARDCPRSRTPAGPVPRRPAPRSEPTQRKGRTPTMRPDQLPEHPARTLEARHPDPAGGGLGSGDDAERPGTDLGWLLDDLVARTDHVRQAVLLTADGLPLSCSDGMRRRDIEHLAAVCSGFHSLARSVGERFAAGGVRQTMVMLDDAYLFITPAGDGSRLRRAERGADGRRPARARDGTARPPRRPPHGRRRTLGGRPRGPLIRL